MKQKDCKHLSVKYLDEQEIWYCPKCGNVFHSDPTETFDDDNIYESPNDGHKKDESR